MASAAASPPLLFATYRLRNIPCNFRRSDLERVIPTHDESEKIVGSSISPDVYNTQDSAQVGTLTFKTIPQATKDLKLGENGSAAVPIARNGPRDAGATSSQENVAVAVDSHFTGFTPLNSCAVDEGSIVEYLVSVESSFIAFRLTT